MLIIDIDVQQIVLKQFPIFPYQVCSLSVPLKMIAMTCIHDGSDLTHQHSMVFLDYDTDISIYLSFEGHT